MNTPAAAPKSFGLLTLLIIVAFYSYALLLQMLPTLLMHEWQVTLQADFVALNELHASFFYIYVPAQLLAGIFYDRFSIKYIFIIGILLCAVSASLCGIAESYTLALLSRIILGVGAALAVIGLLVFISHQYPKGRFASLSSMLQILYALSALLPFYTPHIAITMANWKISFLLLSLFGLGMAITAMIVIKDEAPQNTLSLQAHLKSVFSSGENWMAVVYSFAIWMPLTIFSGLWGVPYLQARYGLSHEIALLAIGMIWLGLAFGSPVIANLSDFLRRRQLLLVLCALTGLIAILTILFNPGLSLSTMYILLALLGIAAAGQNLAFALINDHNPKGIRATSFGLNSLAILIGGALFQPLIGFLLDWHWGGQFEQNLPVYSTIVYQRALIVLIPCYGIALFVSALLLKEEAS